MPDLASPSNPSVHAEPAPIAGDGKLAELLAFLSDCGEAPVAFAYEGREAAAGLHVTEVKSGRFSGLDCGANPEQWTETFIQIWEAQGETGPLTARTFEKIMAKVAGDTGLDPESRLTFEANREGGVIGLYALDHAMLEQGCAVIALAPRRASCKPRDRWLADQRAAHEKAGASCCGPEAPLNNAACCN